MQLIKTSPFSRNDMDIASLQSTYNTFYPYESENPVILSALQYAFTRKNPKNPQELPLLARRVHKLFQQGFIYSGIDAAFLKQIVIFSVSEKAEKPLTTLFKKALQLTANVPCEEETTPHATTTELSRIGPYKLLSSHLSSETIATIFCDLLGTALENKEDLAIFQVLLEAIFGKPDDHLHELITHQGSLSYDEEIIDFLEDESSYQEKLQEKYDSDPLAQLKYIFSGLFPERNWNARNLETAIHLFHKLQSTSLKKFIPADDLILFTNGTAFENNTIFWKKAAAIFIKKPDATTQFLSERWSDKKQAFSLFVNCYLTCDHLQPNLDSFFIRICHESIDSWMKNACGLMLEHLESNTPSQRIEEIEKELKKAFPLLNIQALREFEA